MLIMVRMARNIRGRQPRPYILIGVAAWAILCASMKRLSAFINRHRCRHMRLVTALASSRSLGSTGKVTKSE